MTDLSLTGRDSAADRRALQALVALQQAAPLAALKACDAGTWLARLAAFKARALQAGTAQPFSARETAAFERAFQALVDSALAQPVVALQRPAGAETAGPVTQDIGTLLREQPLDEDLELDLAVRWWQLARAAGLPVDADFGETWRALEWTNLLRHLARLGAEAGPPPAHVAGLALKVALRYAPLKPLALLLQPLTGATPKAGYTF